MLLLHKCIYKCVAKADAESFVLSKTLNYSKYKPVKPKKLNMRYVLIMDPKSFLAFWSTHYVNRIVCHDLLKNVILSYVIVQHYYHYKLP